MRSDRGARTLGVWLAVLAAVGLPPLAAQEEEEGPATEEGRPTFANLTMSLDAHGDGKLTLELYGREVPADLLPRLRQTLPCQLGPAKKENGLTAVSGRCPGLLRRKGGVFRGRLGLGSALSLPRETAAFRFSSAVDLPRTPATRCDGWQRLPWSETHVHCVPGGAFGTPRASVESPVEVTYGYRAVDVLWRLAVLAALAGAPLALMLRRRRPVLLAPDEEARRTAWFAYWRAFRAIHQTGWLLWIAAFFALRIDDWLTFALSAGTPRVAAEIALLTGPPTVVFLLSHALSHPVLVRVHELAITRREALLEAVGYLCIGFLPLPLTVLGCLAVHDRFRVVVWYFGAALLIVFVGRRLLIHTTGQLPHALSIGELRDRIFALADKVRVKLQGVYILPASRRRMANAFATSGNTVILTDYLLHNLTKREAVAVAAHEVAHLRYRHPLLQVVALLVIVYFGRSIAGILALFLTWPFLLAGGNRGALTTALSQVTDSVSFMPLVLLLGLLPLQALSRRHERSADAYAGALTGDPEAMISALGKLSRLSLLPLRWSQIQEALSTHPSMERRGEALALRFGIPFQRMHQLLAGEAAPAATAETDLGDATGYALPASVLDPERVFTTRFKVRSSLRMGWSAILTTLGLSLAAAVWMKRTGGLSWGGFGAAVLGILLVRLVLENFLAPAGYAELRRRLAARLERDGTPEGREAAADGVFVGFAPDARPRNYEGHSVWDIGFVLLGLDALVYIGDQARFRLRREQITGVRRDRGNPSWLAVPVVCIDWRAEDGAQHTVRLRPVARTLLGCRALTARFARTLTAWHRTGEGSNPLPATAAELPMPFTAAVTGQSPRANLRLLPLLKVVWLETLILATAALLLEQIAILFPALLLAVTVLIIQLVPSLLYREPAAKP